MELAGSGVRVHVLYPGWVPTAMGLSGNEDGGTLPPKMVRRTAQQVATLVGRPDRRAHASTSTRPGCRWSRRSPGRWRR